MYLSILANAVAQANKARLELIRSQAANSVLVEVVEAAAELVELLLKFKIRPKFLSDRDFFYPSDALGVSGEDLVLDFVNVAVDGGEQLFPAHPQRVHGELSVPILEDHALLHGLVDLLKLLNVGLVGEDGLFVLPEAQQLVLERALDAHADGGDRVHLLLDPRTHVVGLLAELATQHLIVCNVNFLLVNCFFLQEVSLIFIRLGFKTVLEN
jgi:hypothetical protein